MNIFYLFYIFGAFGVNIEDGVTYKWIERDPDLLPLRFRSFSPEGDREEDREEDIRSRFQNVFRRGLSSIQDGLYQT